MGVEPDASHILGVGFFNVSSYTKILKPLVGKSPHHINNIHDFLEQIKQSTLAPGECLISYDVSALFTSVPVDPALGIIKDLLEKDPTLKDGTVHTVNGIIQLLEFCLKNMYFSFQDQFYEQVEGEAIGSLFSSIVVNLYMEYFEQKTLSAAPIWKWMTLLSLPKGRQQTGHPTAH